MKYSNLVEAIETLNSYIAEQGVVATVEVADSLGTIAEGTLESITVEGSEVHIVGRVL